MFDNIIKSDGFADKNQKRKNVCYGTFWIKCPSKEHLCRQPQRRRNGEVMDRRQQKTRQAIFNAFSALLEHKKFNQITVQEIIDRANIGRSTFYAHFGTKEELLNELCSDMFRHVFSDHLETEPTHDFSGSSNERKTRITHILYLLKNNQAEIIRLLSGESGELFLNYFKSYLKEMFAGLVKESSMEIPVSYLENFLVGSFTDTIEWWVRQRMATPPDTLAKYYLTVIEHGFRIS